MRSKRAWLFAALAALALAIYLLFGGSRGTPRASTTAEAATLVSVPSSDDVLPPIAEPAPIPPQGAPPAVAPPAPIVDKITVEKKEVCEGEENLISIEAHDPSGNNAGLRYLVNGFPGMAVPLATRENTEDPNAPPRSVLVVGYDGATTTVPIPKYKIKDDCAATARLRMRHLLLPNSTAEYRLEAKLVSWVSPGRPMPARFEMADFKPVRFEWDFGDGQKTTTTEAFVEHSYEMRDQRTFFTYHLLKVTAFDERGRSLVARDALEIMNPAYEERTQKKLVKLMTQNAPRFPELKDGKVQQLVHIWHFDDNPVPIEQVIAYYYDPFGKELGHAPVPAVDLLGTNRIPTGMGLTIRVTLEVDQHPEIGFITYDLHGTGANGMHAMGSFSIMRPPEAPTREKNIPVTDGMQAAKIKRAMEILGRSTVTDEDIWALERQGRFEGLEPLPVPDVDDGPPSWLPTPARSDGEPWSPEDDPGPYAPE